VAPTTTAERVAEIGADARGFVYAVSLTGTTGERLAVPGEGLANLVGRIRAATRLPVAVGFGIATGEQASAVAEVADGVIVGTRLVRAAGEEGPAAVGRLVGELATALG
jgi:tryptophan synthase alpha chain